MTMSYYMENDHILHLPSQAKFPGFSVLKSNTSDIFTESKTPAKIYILLNLTRTERTIGYSMNLLLTLWMRLMIYWILIHGLMMRYSQA